MPSEMPEFQPRCFRSTVPYYARYRLGYPAGLIARVATACGLEAEDTVLDLGCGPGILALAFARLGARVVAVDPEPDMLAAGRAAAQDAGLAVDFREGSSFALPADLGDVKLVTMGRSFHWMDRTETLRTLDRLIRPDGAIALFGEHHPSTRENGWHRIIGEVSKAYGGDMDNYRAQWRGSEGLAHEAYLFDSAFCELEGMSVFVRHRLSVGDLIGRVLSLSLSSPEKLGDRQAAFEADLRKALLAFAPDGRLSEIAEMKATLARRP